ncbi:alpha/beta fold hydrolase [Desulfogranum mediterraneum]|uniref:alpha/beta fold hydrolase n=1 Tax=Desulfogranum mediterraneum TaxID=160661 RepID=UPI00040FCC89|nr:alpha/beta fold hydrolase [Desulfogranum mediterraneum]
MEPSQLAEYPFSPRRCRVNGQEMAYLDEGQGPVVVMVHGNPSWSYLYRNLVSHLKGGYRCIVPDHLGCGFSAKPQDQPYTLEQHINNLEALLASLEIERCVLVVHDWGGAIGMGWAGRHPERVQGMVVMNTAAFRSTRIPLRISVCRWPLLGPLLVRGLNVFARAAVFMAVAKPMPPKVAAGFLAPYDSWHNRLAILRFVQDIPLRASHRSWSTLVEVEQSLARLAELPMLLCWGGQDFCFNDHFFQGWRLRFPQAEAHSFKGAGHYLLEDALEEIVPLIDTFLSQRNQDHDRL